MKISGPSAAAYGIALSFLSASLLSGCSGGGSSDGDNGGPMYIQACSLGCSSGAGGTTVSCTIVSSSLNNEIAVVFSEPVDPASVDSSTFQLIDAGSGQVPLGTRLIDPSNPRKILFRPSISFDSQGNAVFGFLPDTTYRVTVPGSDHGDPAPFIRSTAGKDNRSRMQCDIRTTDLVDDVVPGNPTVEVFVDIADTSTTDNVDDHFPNQPAAFAVDVWRNSEITFVFNDIMNPQTLANPVTHQSSLISVEVDSDGNPGSSPDQVPLFGNYFVQVNVAELRTVMTFVPANGMPSAGDPALHPGGPRVVIVRIPAGVQDIAGHGIANPGTTTFTPELVEYAPLVVPDADGENFTDQSRENGAESGAIWGDQPLGVSWQVLTRGWGGGSGRLGELRVSDVPITLDTDGTVFKHQVAPDPTTSLQVVATTGLIDNSRPGAAPAGYDADDLESWPTVPVTDGIFEFSSLRVEAGATLRIIGSNHARVFSRGPVLVDGTIDVRGESCLAHVSDEPDGETGARGGPNGGDGGDGADRADNSGNPTILNLDTAVIPGVPGIANPGAVIAGAAGGGVGRTVTATGGKGGINNPDPFPTSVFNTMPDRGGTLYTYEVQFDEACRVRQVASPGAGGGYSKDGGNARPITPFPFALNPAEASPPPFDEFTVQNRPASTARGGSSGPLLLEPADPQSGHVKRTLDADSGYLRGGAGGGGGGASLWSTDQVGPYPPQDGCYNSQSTIGLLSNYFDHSAGGGGGGGGALQLVCGKVMRVAGEIQANGGNGSNNVNIQGDSRASRASPGGGGSGGAVCLQALDVNLLPANPPRIDVGGGAGGINLSPSQDKSHAVSLGWGGAGAAGLVRLEDISDTSVDPPDTLMTRCSEAPRISPLGAQTNPNTPNGDPCFGLPESEAILSVGAWALPTLRPETFTGAVSCWIRPPGNFFTLHFTDDSAGYGWNMKVDYDSPTAAPVLINYRGPDPNSPFGSGDFETNLGSTVNYANAANPPGNQFGTGAFVPGTGGTYLAVRFQGAVATTDISIDPCDVQLSGVGAEIAGSSLTPWVRHPAELNEFLPAPNMIRFCVVFDGAVAVPASVSSFIRGITGLLIHATPD